MAVITAKRVRLEKILAETRQGFHSRSPIIREDVLARPMRAGAAMLTLFGTADDWLPQGRDTLPPYGCHVHVIENARVVSSTGIIVLSTDEVIEDTIDHTDPVRDGYRNSPELLLQVMTSAKRMRGRFLSLLLGAYDNHFHWLVMSLGRLAILSQAERSMIDGILIPADLSPIAEEALRYAAAAAAVTAPLVPVERGTSLVVDTLILPWNVASGYGVNPDIVKFFRDWLQPRRSKVSSRRIYIDRTGSPLRPLLNENELIAVLRANGVEPIANERLTLGQQIERFSEAKLIVAPHGAGMTNLVFAPDTASVLELMPFDHPNWCYRNLAAACGQSDDAVFGRRVAGPSPDAWMVSIGHVLGALSA